MYRSTPQAPENCASCDEQYQYDYRAMAPVSYYHTPYSQAAPYGYGQPMPQGQGTPMYMTPPIPSGANIPPAGATSPGAGGGAAEESYIENILRFNRGKVATLYFTYENNTEWNARVYRGVVETAGRDHIIISDPRTGKRYVLLMVNLDWIEFDEELAYIPPAHPPAAALTTGVESGR